MAAAAAVNPRAPDAAAKKITTRAGDFLRGGRERAAACAPTPPTQTSQEPSYGHGMTGGSTPITVGNRWLDPGDTGFIAARQIGPDRVEVVMGAMKPPVPSCFPDAVMQAPAARRG